MTADKLSKTFHWFFTDMVASSDPILSIENQIVKIQELIKRLKKTRTFKLRNSKSSIIHWTGDGVAIGFSDSPEKPIRLAVELHKTITKYNKSRSFKDKIRIRTGISTGPIYLFKDIEGRKAIWGDGIIMARRIMDICGPNQILASSEIATNIGRLSPEYKKIIHQIGKYKVKHNEELEIYNIYGKDFGNKAKPLKYEIKEVTPPYEFNEIRLTLEVTDPKTMKAHHIYYWDVTNTTKEPLEHLRYQLEGDVPRDFEKLNVKITTQNGKKLEISNILTDRPFKKEFEVHLGKSLLQRQRRIIKMEFDWEEPERFYFYRFSADCKKFKYLFTIPAKVKVQHRIYQVNLIGQNFQIKSSPKIKYFPKNTEISWSAKNVKMGEGYGFHW